MDRLGRKSQKVIDLVKESDRILWIYPNLPFGWYSLHYNRKRLRALTTLFLYISLLNFQGAETVKLASLKIPKYAIRAHAVRLECHYDLEGEALYSVKWYKDDKEFYRFLPGEDPPAHTFNLPGLPVELQNSTDTAVVLSKVDFNSSGIYRCEISGEAPAFRTVVESSQMLVVDLPDDGPHIEGGRPRYAIGDIISVNCSSTRARPGAKLTWQVNGNQAPEEALRKYQSLRHEEQLETSILGLHFKIRKHHFINRMLKIKCVATIEDFYWRTNEENVLENHYDRSVHEGKSSFNPGKRDASSSSSVGDYCQCIMILLTTSVITIRNLVIQFQSNPFA